MNRSPILAALLLIPFLIGTAQGRSWTDDQGRTIEAEFILLSGDAVQLKLADGKIYEVKLGSLSEADRAYIEKKSANSKGALISKAVERIDRAIEDGLGIEGLGYNEGLNDYMFVRRVYLDVAGRIPTYEETKAFFDSRDSNKRKNLVATLLSSEESVSHLYNYFADLLRVQSTIPGTVLRTEPFIHWLKGEIRKNTPFDEMVNEMVSADGRIWENPAAAYHLRDNGMKLDHVSFMGKIFLGTDITCAQCHDDPFKDWTQYEYYELSAYLGDLETKRSMKAEPSKTKAKGMNRKELEAFLIKKHKIDRETEAGERKLRGFVNRYNRAYRDITRANELVVHTVKGRELRLPDTYEYEDAKPNSVVAPRVLFGEEIVKSSKTDTPRQRLADWLTSEANDHFAMNIANRMWARFFGRGVAMPLHDMNIERADNPELLKILAEEMVNLDFDLKAFSWAIMNTKAYNRLATRSKVPDNEAYYFSGPLLRRMSAEQVWDSLVTLMLENPMEYQRNEGSEYNKIINFVQKGPQNLDQILARVEAYNNFKPDSNLVNKSGKSILVTAAAGAKKPKSNPKKGEEVEMTDEMAMMSIMGAASKKRMTLARASELPQPAPNGHFLRSFGQSSRDFVVGASSTEGSVPQVMELMNGYATEILTHPSSLIFQKVKKEESILKQAEVVFLSILNRRMLDYEKGLLLSELRDRGDEAFSDLIWSLLNTPEFLFIK